MFVSVCFLVSNVLIKLSLKLLYGAEAERNNYVYSIHPRFELRSEIREICVLFGTRNHTGSIPDLVTGLHAERNKLGITP